MPAAKVTQPYHSARSESPPQYSVAASAAREHTMSPSAFCSATPAGRKASDTR